MSCKNGFLMVFLMGLACLSIASGCRRCRVETISPNCVENASQNCCLDDSAKINFLSLRRTPPDAYILDSGDTLGIYIQGITGDATVPPPVHFSEVAGEPPALGYPVPIRDDGYIALPLIQPIQLAGLTLGQAEARIRDAYTKDRQILKKENAAIIVTLMQRRTYNVLVVREDLDDTRTFALRKNDLFVDQSRQGQTFSIELAAYENDVLHALSETGGMPGENAKNEIVIMRGALNNSTQSPEAIIEAINIGDQSQVPVNQVTRIPIRPEGGLMPTLSEAEITLEDGDIIYIEGRQRDVFYTGGLMDGGRFPLPRDYKIDVLEAISMAGGSVSSAAGSSAGGGFRGIGTIMPATKVTVVRNENCQQKAIEVDLRCSIADPTQRVIIKPGDLILLEYRPRELFINSMISVLQFGGVFRLFSNNN